VPTLYARALRRAAEIIGEETFVARLGVSKTQLRFWMQGLGEPPSEVFLKIVDILDEHSLDELRRPRPSSAGPDRDAA
jgi:hypothetical protein